MQTKQPIQKRFISRQEVAEILGISLPTISRRLADGSIPHTTLGGKVLIPLTFIDDLEKSAGEKE